SQTCHSHAPSAVYLKGGFQHLMQVLDDAIGSQNSRDCTEAHPLTRMSRATGQVEPAHAGTAMAYTALAHELGGHHRVHAIGIQLVFVSPLLGRASGQNTYVRQTPVPPIFTEQLIEIRGLTDRASSFGLRVVHGSEKPGWGTTIHHLR